MPPKKDSNILIHNDLKKSHILKGLPKSPGVYLMKDEEGKVIYVGKAKDLSKRVKHYFQSSPNHSAGTRVMMPKIADIEIIKVNSELEALLLEINQIKKYTPRYNVIMKDDKNYAYLKVTINEDYPRIFGTRIREKDKSLYFGPYMSIRKVEEAVDIVKKIFPYRSCKGTISWKGEGETLEKKVEQGRLAIYKPNVENKNIGRKIPCLEYHIKRCSGPCLGIVKKEEYFDNIMSIVHFLKGKYKPVNDKIKDMMQKAVLEKNFEWAAKLRDQLKFIQDLSNKQSVVNVDAVDQDIMSVCVNGSLACVALLQIRDGKLLQILYRELHVIEGFSAGEALERFIADHYMLTSDFPDYIFLSHELDSDIAVLEEWFLQECDQKIKVSVPQRGGKKDLVKLAFDNAEQYLKSKQASFEDSLEEKGMKELQDILELKKAPKRIECYDIAHIQGTNTVASMVVLMNGKPHKADYRRFQIHSAEGKPDDYQSMIEVMERRLSYLEKDDAVVSVKKATKSIMATYVEKSYSKAYKEKLLWFIATYKEHVMIVGVEIIDEKVAIISTYKSEIEIPEDIQKEMFVTLFYKLKQTHIYIATIREEFGLFISFGAVEVPNIPEKYKHLGVDGNVVVTWYKSQKKRHKKDTSFASKPDIILIDGGKGQLSSAYSVLKGKEIKDIVMISLAKQHEEIFCVGKKQSIQLGFDNSALRILVRARDESHRFANTYHAKKRDTQMIQSELDSIPGIGKKTKTLLLKTFGSVEEIRKAPVETVEEYVGRRVAKIIESYLK